MKTYLLKLSNSFGETMDYITDQETIQGAINLGHSNPLYYLDSVHSVDEDMEEMDLLWEK